MSVTDLPVSFTGEQLAELLGIPFTDEQLAAITAPLQPTLIVAGAGSGKTSVMAARVVWAVATGQVRPDQVLGLTFTNKAAAELATRVRRALARLPESPGDAEDRGEPTVSTYHAYAGRLLGEHALRLGIEPSARLLADATRFQLAQRTARRAGGPFSALSRRFTTVVADIIALDGELSEHLVEPRHLRAFDERVMVEAAAGQPVAAVRTAAQVAAARLDLLRLVEDFRAAKRAGEVVDFGDQVALAARLAEAFPEVAADERDRFRIVLLDEYQDTSVAQRRLLAGLFHGHAVTAVGDPCQAIYGWRGASVGNLDAFPRHFAADTAPAATHELSVNMRSGGRLLQLANAVATPLRAIHPTVVELAPRPSVAEHGTTVCALLDSWSAEVEWVADRIEAAITDGASPGGCAVLVRAKSAFRDLFDALVERGIPAEVVGLDGLLTMPAVVDVVSTLELLDDPAANVAMLRLLTGPRWRIGGRDLAALGRLAAEVTGSGAASIDDDDPDAALLRAVQTTDPVEMLALGDALDEVVQHADRFSPEAVRRMTALAAELRSLRRHAGEPLVELTHRVIEAIGLDVELTASPEAVAGGQSEAVRAFLDHVSRFVGVDGEASLPAFLAYLRAADDYGDEPRHDAGAGSGRDAVQLLTVHKAKGLEWDVVAVPAVCSSVFPSTKGRSTWLTGCQVLPFPLRGDASDLPALAEWTSAGIRAFTEANRAHAEVEERRLAYVAVTRARHTLIMSGHWWGPTQKKPRGPSPYLLAARDHCVSGGGEVAMWADPPLETVNPALETAREVPWPTPLAEAPQRRRREAAEWVREELRRLADGAPSDGYRDLDMVDAAVAAGWDEDLEVLLREARGSAEQRTVVELPAVLSASRLVRLASEPGRLARELARPVPRPPSARARRGTEFHAWVESLFGPRPLLDPDDVPGASDAAISDDELDALKAAFLATPYASRTPVQLEAPFELVLAGRVIRGRIDAVYADGDGFEVVDWKTGREPADPLQLAIYRLAWAELMGVPVDRVRAGFLYVRDGRVEHFDELPGRSTLQDLFAR